MVNTPIEIIFEECGWVYVPTEGLWRLGKLKLSRIALHKAIDAGKGPLLRKQMIAKFVAYLEGTEIPELAATVERLKVKSPSK